jgi:hypothetical protein
MINIVYWLFVVVIGLLFCQSVALMFWHVLAFFSEVSPVRRWWISFLLTAALYGFLMFSQNIFTLAAVAFFCTSMEVTYILQDRLLHKYPHWERDGVLYLSLLMGGSVAFGFAAFSYLIFSLVQH